LTSVLMGGQVFGGGATGFIPHDRPMNVSQTFIAIDIARFTPLETFTATMDQVLDAVHETGVRPGFDYVYYPGERGAIEMERRRRTGIPIQSRVVTELNELAADAGVNALTTEEQSGEPGCDADGQCRAVACGPP